LIKPVSEVVHTFTNYSTRFLIVLPQNTGKR
jgi:hypothetical protein